MKIWLIVAASLEVLFGVYFFTYPSYITPLLFDADMQTFGTIITRIIGISLFSLGCVCWPTKQTNAFSGLVIYGMGTVTYLTYLGVTGYSIQLLLWPAVLVHAIFILMLGLLWFNDRKAMA